MDKTLRYETLTLTTKNWTVVYSFIGAHFQSDQNFSKQNTETRDRSLFIEGGGGGGGGGAGAI